MNANQSNEMASRSCSTISAVYACIAKDLLDYISASYPNIWALNGMYFNDDANDQLASYFKSQYTIYCQHGLNSFCGVCLAIALDVSHRIASELNNVDNIIGKHVMICL